MPASRHRRKPTSRHVEGDVWWRHAYDQAAGQHVPPPTGGSQVPPPTGGSQVGPPGSRRSRSALDLLPPPTGASQAPPRTGASQVSRISTERSYWNSFTDPTGETQNSTKLFRRVAAYQPQENPESLLLKQYSEAADYPTPRREPQEYDYDPSLHMKTVNAGRSTTSLLDNDPKMDRMIQLEIQAKKEEARRRQAKTANA